MPPKILRLAPCLSILAAASVHAQTPATVPPPPSPPAAIAPAPASPAPLGDALTGPAKDAYESGKQLFGVGDFAAALIKFHRAYEASKDARLLWNVATCEGKLHHYARAVGLVRQYLKESGPSLTEQDRAEAEQTVKVLEPLTSTLKVTVSEAGADVYVDDQPIGKSPVDVQLVDIGVHRVRAHQAEFEDAEQPITVNGGAVVSVDLTLRPIVHEGSVHVHAGLKDAIAIDGQPVGVGAWSGPLKSGGHTLRVTAKGMLAYQTEVLLRDGQSRDIEVTLDPEPRKGLAAWVWVAGGVVAAGGLGAGGYFLLKPTSKYDGPGGSLNPGIVQAAAHLHL